MGINKELYIKSLQFVKMKSFLLFGLIVMAFNAAANPIEPVADKETGEVVNLMEPREKTFVKPSGLRTMRKDADVGESARIPKNKDCIRDGNPCRLGKNQCCNQCILGYCAVLDGK